MTTYIYGVIVEYGLNQDRLAEIYTHNEAVISKLPISDAWPPLSKEMFSITRNIENFDGPNFEYYGRVIHFGASLKSVEYEWKEWKSKFESLLLNLYWTNAHVHFKTEYTGVLSFTWKVDVKKWSISKGPILPIQRQFWEFEDTNSWEE